MPVWLENSSTVIDESEYIKYVLHDVQRYDGIEFSTGKDVEFGIEIAPNKCGKNYRWHFRQSQSLSPVP